MSHSPFRSTANNPVLLNFNVHPVVGAAIVEFGKKDSLTASAGCRLVLHHFLVPGSQDARVAAALAAPKQDLVLTPGLKRLHCLGINTNVAAAQALMAKALVTPNPAPTPCKPMSDVNDVARAILEAVFLSPADRKLVVSRLPKGNKRVKTQGMNISAYLNEATRNRLNTLLEGKLVSRSMFLSLLVEDALNGTNKAVRLLALPPSQQPERRTQAMVDALG